jgi:pimeloyl-ACP methyl ester carboxylesterase
MMYPPAGFSNESAERYYQLTAQANTQGYVVVYSAAIPLSGRALRMQHEVASQVIATWCIDPQRVVFAGHSDGGSVTTGLTVREPVPSLQPASVVISAAGITAEDLQQEHCPAPLNVTVTLVLCIAAMPDVLHTGAAARASTAVRAVALVTGATYRVPAAARLPNFMRLKAICVESGEKATPYATALPGAGM